MPINVTNSEYRGSTLPRGEYRVSGDAVGLHAALDEVDVEVDETAHLDGAAEGDLTVALREVRVAAGEQRSGHLHRGRRRESGG